MSNFRLFCIGAVIGVAMATAYCIMSGIKAPSVAYWLTHIGLMFAGGVGPVAFFGDRDQK